MLAESRGADGTDDVRPSLAEPVASDGTGAEQSVLAESCAATDGTGIERSVLAESCVATDGTGAE